MSYVVASLMSILIFYKLSFYLWTSVDVNSVTIMKIKMRFEDCLSTLNVVERFLLYFYYCFLFVTPMILQCNSNNSYDLL